MADAGQSARVPTDIIIYHNPDCGTSRNTLAMIRNAGVEPHIIEYLKTPPSRAMLAQLIARMGIATRALLREKGTPYADLGLGDPALTDDALVDAMMAVHEAGARSHGQVYNLGGGMQRAVSVLEMLRMIEERTGERINVRECPVRPGDQPLYISDTSKLEAHTGWRPQRSLADTLASIHDFWKKNSSHIGTVQQPVSRVSELAGEVA